MARSDFTEDQKWLLGELEAPVRAAQVRDVLEQRLGPLLDWGFSVHLTSGGATVSLGSLTLITALCEGEPCNGDSVWNFVATRIAPAEFQSQMIEVGDKTQTSAVALEQLELALASLRIYANELASEDVPMGWASNDRFQT